MCDFKTALKKIILRPEATEDEAPYLRYAELGISSRPPADNSPLFYASGEASAAAAPISSTPPSIFSHATLHDCDFQPSGLQGRRLLSPNPHPHLLLA